jgi:hypothetical protein
MGVDWVNLARDRGKFRAIVNMVTNLPVNSWLAEKQLASQGLCSMELNIPLCYIQIDDFV